MTPPQPPPEALEEYRRQMKKKKAPTKIPNEDFVQLKKTLLDLRAKAEAKAKSGTITPEDLAQWRTEFPDLAVQRPTLFMLVANPAKPIQMAIGMVDILQQQRESKNYDIEDANHKLVNYMCDSTGFEQGKQWLKQAEKERRDARLNRVSRTRK